MAYYMLWFLGVLICVLAAIFLFKNVSALNKSITFQKQFKKIHPEAVLGSFDRGWIFLDVILALLVLSMATQASTFNGQDEFAPDSLCFIGIAIFCASKAVEQWNKGRLVFYSQGVIYQTDDILYTSIRSFDPSGGKVELKAKKGVWLITRRQSEAIQEKMVEWRKKRREKKS